MTIRKGIIIHRYLDDWLVKATSHQVYLQHKSKLEPKAGLRPCRLAVRPHGRSGPTYTGKVESVQHVVRNTPVGGRLQKFWQVWLSQGSNPRVVSILREGYSLPFKVKPPLSRSPVIVSGYTNPVRNKHLKESLIALIQKQAVEKVVVPTSLASYKRLFLVPKPNKWRPILDLSQLNLYLATASSKMETPETIRLSLQKGEWVTSLDFSDAYFHVPINQRSRKFLRFHLNSQTYCWGFFSLFFE